jgi:NAD(P)-dependent dehydrogenase (short-subunit alcohol dehydrogenase family)
MSTIRTPDASPNDWVWLVTGCSSGLGRSLIQRLVDLNRRVVAALREPRLLSELAEAHPANLAVQRLDVTKRSEITAAVSAGRERFSRIDVLVNNAGYGLAGGVEEVTDEEIHAQFATNLFGPLHLMREVLPGMREQRFGRIVNVSSTAGFTGPPGLGIYAASKHAIEGLSEAVSRELSHLGIVTMIVEPGAFRTEWSGASLRVTERCIKDYEDTARATVRLVRSWYGRQCGDPERAADAIISAVQSATPPIRLVLGSDGYQRMTEALARRAMDLETWKSVSFSTDFH